MARYLLDTDTLIDYLRGKAATAALLEALSKDGHLLALCCINITELYSGLTEAEQEEVVEVISGISFLPVTRRAAARAGQYRYVFARQGIQLPVTDATIAATAVEYGATLITGNVSHYPMKELALITRP